MHGKGIFPAVSIYNVKYLAVRVIRLFDVYFCMHGELSEHGVVFPLTIFMCLVGLFFVVTVPRRSCESQVVDGRKRPNLRSFVLGSRKFGCRDQRDHT